MTLLFTAATGLNTVDDPTNIDYDLSSGVSDLAEAVNVQINGKGKIERTDGYSQVRAGAHHSLWCEDGIHAFVGYGTALYALNLDETLTGVRSGLTGNRFSFCQVKEKTFYTDGTYHGMVIDKVSSSWKYNDPTVSYKKDTVLVPVPAAEKISFWNGRIFFTIDDVLYWTELGLLGLYSPKLNARRLRSRIIMIKPVDGGIFASDEEKTYFLGGMDPHDFTLNRVAEFPAYEWSVATDYVEGSEIGAEPGRCAFWNSPEGAICGTSSGRLINMNKEKLIYPETGDYGAGFIRGYTFINSIF